MLQDRIVRDLTQAIEDIEKQEFLHPVLLGSINQVVLCNSRLLWGYMVEGGWMGQGGSVQKGRPRF